MAKKQKDDTRKEENPNRSLMMITQELKHLELSIIEAGGEITPEIENQLMEVHKDLELKIDGYDFYMDYLDSAAEVYEKRAKRLTTVARGLKGFSKTLKERIKIAMMELDRKEIQGDEVCYKLLENPVPKLVIDDASKIPPIYQVVSYSPDADKIKNALLAETLVPGCRLETGLQLRVSAAKGRK